MNSSYPLKTKSIDSMQLKRARLKACPTVLSSLLVCIINFKEPILHFHRSIPLFFRYMALPITTSNIIINIIYIKQIFQFI